MENKENIIKQFQEKFWCEKDFDRAIKKAMKELKIPKQKALSYLMIFMTANGSTEDFKNYINYFTNESKKA